MSNLLLQARALASAGRLAHFQSDFSGARALLEEALDLFRQTGDQKGAVSALSTLIVTLTWRGETDAALELLNEGLAQLPLVGEQPDALPVLSEFGWAASHISAADSVVPARALNEEVIRRAHMEGDRYSLGVALACLAQCFYWQEEWEAARLHYEESLPLLREVATLWMIDYALWGLGQAFLRVGELEAARTISSEAMTREREVETWIGAPYYLETFAFLAVLGGHPQSAVRLVAAADAHRARHKSVAQPLVRAQTESFLSSIRTSLSANEYESQWQKGRGLTIVQAIALALKSSDEVTV